MMDPVPFVTNDDAAAAYYYDDKNQLHHCSGGSKGDIWSNQQRHQWRREGAQRHAAAAEA